jgi:virginiamycin B lyase
MHQGPRRSARRLTAAAIFALLVSACGQSPAASTQPSGPGAATGAPTTAATPDPGQTGAWTGGWTGVLEDPSGSYPAELTLEACVDVGSVCGELEYLDPGPPDTVMCASALTLTGRQGDRLAFSEAFVYRGWACFPTTFEMTRAADGSLAVEQFGEPGVVCCRGTFAPAPDGPKPTPAIPPAVAGLGRVTAVTALGGTTTQYPGVGAGSLWLPLDDVGAVARVDPATGAVVARIVTGDPGAVDGLKTDPHGVAVGATGIWVAQAAAKAVARIDTATNAVAESIPLPVIPYAVAIDGATLWATSFENDRVVRVDLATGSVVAEIVVSKPTGIAVGMGGVWVVRHRDDSVVRIDPKTNKVVAEISLGARGPNETCGMCVENLIVSDGSVWTANNWGRSISRIDPKTNTVAATISLQLRPWAVAAGGGRIWASQFEGSPDGRFLDQPSWAVAAIDPATNSTTSYQFPGAFSVTFAGDVLWVVMPGRRGDILARVELAP